FPAEAGIRDFHVTGVQTCALPISDTASLPLVVSNLVNIVSADYFGIGFADYASVMVPVNLVAVAASLGMLMWFFRRDIPASYEAAGLKAPRLAIRSEERRVGKECRARWARE